MQPTPSPTAGVGLQQIEPVETGSGRGHENDNILHDMKDKLQPSFGYRQGTQREQQYVKNKYG